MQFSGCKKTADLVKKGLPENISRQELSLWISHYQKIMPNGTKPKLDQTTKTYYKGQMILKMPLSEGGGNLYFTKTDHLEVYFIRIIPIDDNFNTPFNGYYEFINMATYEYQKIIIKNGLIQSKATAKKNSLIKSNSIANFSYSWLGQFLYCLSRYITAVPAKNILGEWGACNVLGIGIVNGTWGENENLNPIDGGSTVDFNVLNWFLTNPPNDYTLPPGPTSIWEYYNGNSGFYDPSFQNEINVLQNGYINSLGYYTPYSQFEIENYFSTLDHYWLSSEYDLILPYNPITDGPRDNNGYRKNGPVYTYKDGFVQNFTNDNGEKYAEFTSFNGTKLKFPGATITDNGILERRGVTTPNGGIHMSTVENGLVDLQHEYGHYLHAKSIGTISYFANVVPESLYSAAFNGINHRFTWTEVVANKLAAAYFGPTSLIATSTFYPKNF